MVMTGATCVHVQAAEDVRCGFEVPPPAQEAEASSRQIDVVASDSSAQRPAR